MDLTEIFNKQNNDIFLIDQFTGKQTTYKEFYKKILSLSWWLQQNFKQQDKIAIMLENSTFFAEFFFSCLYSGIIVVPISLQWGNAQIEFVLKESGVKSVLINKDDYSKFSHIFSSLNIIACIPEDIITESNPTNTNPLKKQDSDTAIIFYTSGSTSNPKGVMHTLNGLITNGLLFAKTVGIDSSCRFLNYLPMNYTAGLFNLLLIPYLAGASVVIGPAFSAATVPFFWENIVLHQVNSLWFAPTILSILLLMDRGKVGEDYCKTQMRFCFVGTAPLRRELKKHFEERYQINLYESYGLTETLLIASDGPNSVVQKEAVGRVLGSIKIKILDNESNILPRGEIGEIAVKTPCLMKQYYGRTHLDSVDNEGYFLTGDVGYLTQHNEIILIDRKKDLVIKGGINISPLSIETILYQHPNVELCAIVGIPDTLAGEEVAAVIKTKDNQPVESIENELKTLCQKHLSKMQQPKYYINLTEFPCTPTGKIQKAKIRKWLTEAMNKDAISTCQNQKKRLLI